MPCSMAVQEILCGAVDTMGGVCSCQEERDSASVIGVIAAVHLSE